MINCDDFVVRYEFTTPVFYEGIERFKACDPVFADIFACTPDVEDNAYCEEEAMWALIDTIRIEKASDFNRPQRVIFLGDDEIAYVTPRRDLLCWKKLGKSWIFWILCRDPQPVYENNDFNVTTLI